MPILIALVLVLALIFLWQSNRSRHKAGLPGGTIIYSDTGGWQENQEALYDPVLDLTGKPDYLVRQGDALIPVEVKTGRTPAAPYDSHIFQLAAYCLLVQRTFGVRPAYGIVTYPHRKFQVEFTPELENALLDLIAEIREAERRRTVERSHRSPQRCARCGYRRVCEQRL